jgi:hypothetical protein
MYHYKQKAINGRDPLEEVTVDSSLVKGKFPRSTGHESPEGQYVMVGG